MSVSAKTKKTVGASSGTRRKSSVRASQDVAQALEDALEQYALLDPTVDAVFAASPDGLIATWSDAAERLFGYSAADVTGEHVSRLWSGRAPEAALARASSGEPVGGVETQAVGKGGKTLTVCVTAAPLRGADGASLGVVVLARATDTPAPAGAHGQSDDELHRAVLAAMQDGVLVQDDSGRVIVANERAREMLGFSDPSGPPSENPLTAFIYGDGSPVPPEELPLSVTLRTGERQSAVVMGLKQRNGHVRWFEVNSIPLQRPGESAPSSAVGTLIDVTEARQTAQELSAARLEDLKRLALVSEYRNDETHRHTERVARSTAMVAMELGLDREIAWTIARAAPLHDVGKVGIPDSVLLKPGKLTDEEFELMKSHTSIGGHILGESGYGVLKMGMEIALTHHERWDGHGYPSGISGEEIPISGRIVAVTDAFDAMTHTRPYRAAISVAEALVELERCSGTQFDPAVVKAFMTLDHASLVDDA